jgi:hypothetical protein
MTGMEGSASRFIDENAFDSWLKSASPGEHLVYHVGHLGFDRSGGSELAQSRRQSLNRVANRAIALAECGRLVLTQQRLDDGRMAYLAIMPGVRQREAA